MEHKGIKRRFEKAKEILGCDDAKVAEYFGITPGSFRSSTARDRYRKAFADIVFDVRSHILSDVFKSLEDWKHEQTK